MKTRHISTVCHLDKYISIYLIKALISNSVIVNILFILFAETSRRSCITGLEGVRKCRG